MSECILVGIDSSTSKTGLSVFINGKYSKCILIDKSNIKDSNEKYKEMCASIINTLNDIKPHIVVIERMHTIRNADSFRKLCKLMGAVQCWCIINRSDYIELSPTEWRKEVNDTGEKPPRKREELKLWSVSLVNKKYGIEVIDDVADAICIGEAYINKWKGITNGSKEN